MAAGTISYPYKRGVDVWGHSRITPVTYVGPALYAAGGDTTFTANKLKLGAIEWVLGGWAIPTAGLTMVIYVYDPAANSGAGALKAFWGNTTPAGVLPEVTDNTDLTTYVATLVVFGR